MIAVICTSVTGRRLLLVLLCLLALVTSASAECVRVGALGQAARPNPTAESLIVAIPLGGWNGRNECGRERVNKEQAASQPRTAVFTCLPDTVDPRGPKGTR